MLKTIIKTYLNETLTILTTLQIEITNTIYGDYPILNLTRKSLLDTCDYGTESCYLLC